jgi:hypothetical protein
MRRRVPRGARTDPPPCGEKPGRVALACSLYVQRWNCNEGIAGTFTYTLGLPPVSE